MKNLKREKLTQARLKELFNYHDGVLYWKKRPLNHFKNKHGQRTFNSQHAGKKAGSRCNSGYYHISLRGKRYLRSRLIFFYHNGYMPENSIDHINRKTWDDKIINLREVTHQCNARNCGNSKNNTSGVKGVVWNKINRKWQSQIMVNRKLYYLGSYKFLSNAICARLAGEQCLNWEGCDSNSPAYQYVKGNIQCQK